MGHPEEKQFIKNEDESNDSREEFLLFNDNHIVFVPLENIRTVEQVIHTWEKVKLLWNNIRF